MINPVAVDLPSHVIVKLPALSPTMETGTIVSWEKKVGDEVEQGDVSWNSYKINYTMENARELQFQ